MLPPLPPRETTCSICKKKYMPSSTLDVSGWCEKCWDNIRKNNKFLNPERFGSKGYHRDKAEIDRAVELGKAACKNADYFHNHPTYDFKKK